MILKTMDRWYTRDTRKHDSRRGQQKSKRRHAHSHLDAVKQMREGRRRGLFEIQTQVMVSFFTLSHHLPDKQTLKFAVNIFFKYIYIFIFRSNVQKPEQLTFTE
ncbi:hypothetical protein BsWGS_26846 [Bradybaena similaris]